MDLSNREIVTVFLFAALIVCAAVAPRKGRRRGQNPVTGLLKSVTNWKILASAGALGLYAAGFAGVAATAGLWHWGLFKETLFAYLFTCIPIFGTVAETKSGRELFKKILGRAVGLSALLGFYFGLVEFSLRGELLFQVAALVLVLLGLAGQRAEQGACVTVALIFGLALLAVVSVWSVVARWETYDWLAEAATVGVYTLMPLVCVPFFYGLGYLSAVEGVRVRLRFSNRRAWPTWHAVAALTVGARGRISLVYAVSGRWQSCLATETSFRDGLRTMQELRQARAKVAELNRQREEQLVRHAGDPSVDSGGLRLDRREFEETKQVLRNLQVGQVGAHRHLGEFSRSLGQFPWLASDGLPAGHGVELSVADDGQRWMAWRRTPSGLVFGVGGLGQSMDTWRYVAEEVPRYFPGQGTGWVNADRDDEPIEWQQHDGPHSHTAYPAGGPALGCRAQQ